MPGHQVPPEANALSALFPLLHNGPFEGGGAGNFKESKFEALFAEYSEVVNLVLADRELKCQHRQNNCQFCADVQRQIQDPVDPEGKASIFDHGKCA